MFNYEKPLQLPPQLEWKYAHEPELLGWTIRARNYSTFIANIGFSLMTGLGLGAAIIVCSVFSKDEALSQPWLALTFITFLLFGMSFGWLGYGQRADHAFRFTKTGWEYCQWKNTPKWHLAAVKWVTGFMVVASLFLISIDPSAIIPALLGPGGMAITYLAMANSKTYQDLQTEYNHLAFDWREISEVEIATNREIVNLKYRRIGKGATDPRILNANIYCKRKEKEVVANFVKGCLPPDTPLVRRKLTYLEID